MKKLMIAAVAASMAGGAFALTAYDYKASVKHFYLKPVTVRVTGFDGTVYQKYRKAASLKGYLIMDDTGITSPTYGGAATGFDYGRNRGFLVVQNSGVETAVRRPKILPAVLDAKWIDTQFRQAHAAKNGLAEGTLFVGGDLIAGIRPFIDEVAGVKGDDVNGAVPRTTPSTTAPAAGTPGFAAISDYVWTSVYLFGQYNGPNWFVAAGAGPFDAFEQDWNDNNLPAGLQRDAGALAAGKPYFHDTWMNGAGIGKYTNPESGSLCCGIAPSSQMIIGSLAGNLKGGIFICTENGINARPAAGQYDWFDTLLVANNPGWEDQFATARITDGSGKYAADVWQNDVWQDGPFEQETTDVVYGTWSIKYNRNFFSDANPIAIALTATETANITAVAPIPAGADAIWAGIKGAARKLNANFMLWDGTEIFDKTAANRFNVPLITPQFKAYYGL